MSIVIERIKGRTVAEIGSGYGKAQYYRGSDQFFFKCGRSVYGTNTAELTLELKKMRTGKTRGRYTKSALKNRLILQLIKELKSLHPFWGYRRVWAWLKYKEEFNINHKRVYDLMRLNKLICRKENGNKALRLIKPKPKTQRANQ